MTRCHLGSRARSCNLLTFTVMREVWRPIITTVMTRVVCVRPAHPCCVFVPQSPPLPFPPLLRGRSAAPSPVVSVPFLLPCNAFRGVLQEASFLPAAGFAWVGFSSCWKYRRSPTWCLGECAHCCLLCARPREASQVRATLHLEERSFSVRLECFNCPGGVWADICIIVPLVCFCVQSSAASLAVLAGVSVA